MGDARLNYDELTYGWFDHFLKAKNGMLEKMPKVRYFTMGSNKWQSSDTWPPGRATDDVLPVERRQSQHRKWRRRLTLAAAGRRTSRTNSTYDPMNPVPSYGGNVCCTGNAVHGGAFDQRKMEERPDILVYSTEPLTKASR